MKASKLAQYSAEIKRARIIQKSLGIKVAARYLAIRNYSIDAALFILLNK